MSTAADYKDACGGAPNKCTKSKCVCAPSFTGPHCLAQSKSDDIVWDPPDSPADVGFRSPSAFVVLIIVAIVGGAALTLTLGTMQGVREKLTRGGYQSVPDADGIEGGVQLRV
ncbi:hypothetical protein TeGR_g4078 [Tetraparma gracilis]|uniref:EGF-like domain-containing protein n=1 Tax=Tetraparma gracilis TaxID=2962635 RepID=A0ABQ6M9Q8_9STRA|nr:hypothetical protein TeGR_g4078 [Tetraparma gracilis]